MKSNTLLNAIRGVWRIIFPWYDAHLLRLENRVLAEMVSDPFITTLNYIANGGIEIKAEIPGAMAGMFMGLFENEPDAKNYLEFRFQSSQGPILVTVVRPGGKTPHELRIEAESKLEAATIALWEMTGARNAEQKESKK